MKNLIEQLMGNGREGFLGIGSDDDVESEGIGVLGLVKGVVGSG